MITCMKLTHTTALGQLYEADCLDFLRSIDSDTVHTFFADPPFNLGKAYGKRGSDNVSERQYLVWSNTWLDEAVRVLAPGGALFVYNLPKWLISYGAHLNTKAALSFKHWIAIDKAHSLPIPNRLSPSHYGMLYYIKGVRPRVFDRDAVRIPIGVCRHCGRDIKDYGGHKKYLNPKGLNLSDVWDDIPPVRHRKYKYRTPNELAPQILERVILLTTREEDVVCDPFVGGGTTALVAERLNRRWICADLNTVTAAVRRLTDLENGCHPEWKSSSKTRLPLRDQAAKTLPLFR
jgi:site-specific DNA-methyltransferase (adenine-specific)